MYILILKVINLSMLNKTYYPITNTYKLGLAPEIQASPSDSGTFGISQTTSDLLQLG